MPAQPPCQKNTRFQPQATGSRLPATCSHSRLPAPGSRLILRTRECSIRTHDSGIPARQHVLHEHQCSTRTYERSALFSIIELVRKHECSIRHHECSIPDHDATALFSITSSVVESVNKGKTLRIKRFQNCPPWGNTCQSRYYDGMLYLMSLMHASGEFRIITPRR